MEDVRDNEVRNECVAPSNLPTMGEGESVDCFLSHRKWYGEDTEGLRLDFEELSHDTNYLLSINDVKCCDMGNIGIVTGQSGAGKTQALSQFVGAVLFGDYQCIRYEYSHVEPRPKVLWIDSEQHRNDMIKVKNRIMVANGMGIQEKMPNFTIAMLRDVSTPGELWCKVLRLIYEEKPTVLVLDGLIDCVCSINDEKECNQLVKELMQTADHYNMFIFCVIHQNPNDIKIAGFLGTITERKASESFVVKKETAAGVTIFTVSQGNKGRGHGEWGEFRFRIAQGSRWGVPEQIVTEQKQTTTTSMLAEQIKKWLIEGINHIEYPATLGNIKEVFRVFGKVTNNDKLKECTDIARNRRFIIEQPQETKKRGQAYSKYILNPMEFPIKEELPFEPPTV